MGNFVIITYWISIKSEFELLKITTGNCSFVIVQIFIYVYVYIFIYTECMYSRKVRITYYLCKITL